MRLVRFGACDNAVCAIAQSNMKECIRTKIFYMNELAFKISVALFRVQIEMLGPDAN